MRTTHVDRHVETVVGIHAKSSDSSFFFVFFNDIIMQRYTIKNKEVSIMTETKKMYYCDICKQEMTKEEITESRENAGSHNIGYIIPVFKTLQHQNCLMSDNLYDICQKCRESIATTVLGLEKGFKEVHNRDFNWES